MKHLLINFIWKTDNNNENADYTKCYTVYCFM
jgi:hypothetical protein